MMVVAFGMLAFGSPEIGVELHQARATNDDVFTKTLEADLAYRQWKHYLQIAALFGCSLICIFTGFRAMHQR